MCRWYSHQPPRLLGHPDLTDADGVVHIAVDDTRPEHFDAVEWVDNVIDHESIIIECKRLSQCVIISPITDQDIVCTRSDGQRARIAKILDQVDTTNDTSWAESRVKCKARLEQVLHIILLNCLNQGNMIGLHNGRTVSTPSLAPRKNRATYSCSGMILGLSVMKFLICI